jgi:hypothetical protein
MAGFVHIFVEGDADVKFISDYIAHIKPDVQINLNKELNKPIKADVCLNGVVAAAIHGLRGWNDIAKMKTAITTHKEYGNPVLVIFAAD